MILKTLVVLSGMFSISLLTLMPVTVGHLYHLIITSQIQQQKERAASATTTAVRASRSAWIAAAARSALRLDGSARTVRAHRHILPVKP
tara:strand:- start:318 stop:584 length:267 start_codon:yes stop_codon:yes gene_type:complete